jgi:alcohol dehydrogenase (cytochrome c)
MCTRIHSISLALAVAGMFTGVAVNAAVTDAMIENDAKSTGDVLTWGMGTEGQHYSPLTQVNTQTVKNLVPASAMSFGSEKQRGQESQPLVHNGEMFVTASCAKIHNR